MIDLGVCLGTNLSSNELIMPNIDFWQNNIKLDGLILTHEDHIGAVPFFEKLGSLECTTSFTASVLKKKFDSLAIKD